MVNLSVLNFLSGETEVCVHVRYDSVSTGNRIPTFRSRTVSSSLRVANSTRIVGLNLPWKMRTPRCLELSELY
jgi:hypothetical protein